MLNCLHMDAMSIALHFRIAALLSGYFHASWSSSIFRHATALSYCPRALWLKYGHSRSIATRYIHSRHYYFLLSINQEIRVHRRPFLHQKAFVLLLIFSNDYLGSACPPLAHSKASVPNSFVINSRLQGTRGIDCHLVESHRFIWINCFERRRPFAIPLIFLKKCRLDHHFQRLHLQ